MRTRTHRLLGPALAPGLVQMHGAEVIARFFHFGMLTIAVLGASSITGEYARSG
jgi:ABC-2 type transport system permease protein